MELHTSTPNTLHTMKKQDLAFPYKKAFVNGSASILYYRLNPTHSVLVVELIGVLKLKGLFWSQKGPDLHKYTVRGIDALAELFYERLLN